MKEGARICATVLNRFRLMRYAGWQLEADGRRARPRGNISPSAENRRSTRCRARLRPSCLSSLIPTTRRLMFRAATACRRAVQRSTTAAGGGRRAASDAARTQPARGHRWGGYAIGAALVAGTSVSRFFSGVRSEDSPPVHQLYASQALRLEQQSAGKPLAVEGSLDPTKLGKDVKWVVISGVVYE